MSSVTPTGSGSTTCSPKGDGGLVALAVRLGVDDDLAGVAVNEQVHEDAGLGVGAALLDAVALLRLGPHEVNLDDHQGALQG